MKGHIRQRGAESWELKFDLGRDPTTGTRRTEYRSFRGTKREAQRELSRLLSQADAGEIVRTGKLTLGALLDKWLGEWAVDTLGAKTRERHSELIEKHIRPHLGSVEVAKLTPADLRTLYGRLVRRDDNPTGLAPRTVLHVHRLIHRALKLGGKFGIVAKNPAASLDRSDRPKLDQREIEILSPAERKIVLEGLHGAALFLPVLVAMSTGARRGEILALRWSDIDFDAGTLRIARAVEATKGRLALKDTKTRHGRRIIRLPTVALAALRAAHAEHLETRLALGLGGRGDDAFVFPGPGEPIGYVLRSPGGLTKDWSRKLATLPVRKVTFHALRHSHASELIAGGVDIVAVSRRLGHSSPTVTLGVYAHLFGDADERAVAVVDRALNAALGGS
jgi:integrase